MSDYPVECWSCHEHLGLTNCPICGRPYCDDCLLEHIEFHP
jgi:hypothetical protein